jgi:hypothetical protein
LSERAFSQRAQVIEGLLSSLAWFFSTISPISIRPWKIPSKVVSLGEIDHFAWYTLCLSF